MAKSTSTSRQYDALPSVPALRTDDTHDLALVGYVAEQLEAILASPMFDASERNRRFLRYIVEETLANGGTRIKGYSVGISVFDREANFDPQIDPVVRIEAGRLRRSLERYYLTDGRRAPVRISVPKGGYVPHFERNGDVVVPTSGIDVTNHVDRSVFLMPFVSISGGDAGRRFAAGLSEELIVEFGKRRDVAVFTPPYVSDADHPAPDIVKPLPARTILGGSIRLNSDHVRVVAHLIDHRDDRHLWSASFDRKLRRLTQGEHDIGRDIVAALLTQWPTPNRD